MIKAFLFDLGGVLYTNGTKKFVETVAQTHHLAYSNVFDVMDGNMGTRYREGKISRDEFWVFVRSTLRLNESADMLEKQWVDDYELLDQMADLIQTLGKTYPIYYLSDNVRERVAKLNERFNFLKLFTGGIFSHDVGVRKPNPKIYRLALDLTRTKPEETVFIDDKPSSLIPARTMGIHTILFTTPEELKVELDVLGIRLN